MHITQFSDIGLRVLLYLSRSGERAQPVTMGEIAAQFDIPANHLVKVAAQLSRAGWVNGTRGRKGGIRLAVAADKLRIGDVLRELEGETEFVDCDTRSCQLKSSCMLREALNAGRTAFYDTMNRYRLSDMTESGAGDQIVRMHRNFMQQTSAAGS